MIPPYSCAVPGRNPGTSSNTTSGMLNASQNRTNRAAFSLGLDVERPASTFGWLATTPTVFPSSRANPVRIDIAYSAWTS
jgi:hypothetical protein